MTLALYLFAAVVSFAFVAWTVICVLAWHNVMGGRFQRYAFYPFGMLSLPQPEALPSLEVVEGPEAVWESGTISSRTTSISEVGRQIVELIKTRRHEGYTTVRMSLQGLSATGQPEVFTPREREAINNQVRMELERNHASFPSGISVSLCFEPSQPEEPEVKPADSKNVPNRFEREPLF